MMGEFQNHQLNSDDIRDLLSSYLDGEITEEERDLVEQALAASPELQRDLETLRRTVALLTALPPMPAPRPFTLTEADVKSVTPPARNLFGLPAWFRGVAALAAVLLCVIAAGSLFWSMQFNKVGQPAAEVANAPAAETTAVAPAPQSAAAPVQPTAQEEPDQAGDAAREAPPQTASATEEAVIAAAQAAPTQTPAATAAIALAVPATDEAAKQAAPPAVDQAPVAEGQAITATQPDQSGTTQQSLAAQPPSAASEAAATPSPAPTVMTFAAPAQESAQENAASAAESAATGPTTADSAAPTQPSPAEKATVDTEVQTDQLRTESAPAPTEAPALKQSPPSPMLTSTLMPQPSATAIPDLPASATPVVGVISTPSAPNTSDNFWPAAGIAVVGLVVIAGIVIWLVRRTRP